MAHACNCRCVGMHPTTFLVPGHAPPSAAGNPRKPTSHLYPDSKTTFITQNHLLPSSHSQSAPRHPYQPPRPTATHLTYCRSSAATGGSDPPSLAASSCTAAASAVPSSVSYSTAGGSVSSSCSTRSPSKEGSWKVGLRECDDFICQIVSHVVAHKGAQAAVLQGDAKPRRQQHRPHVGKMRTQQ